MELDRYSVISNSFGWYAVYWFAAKKLCPRVLVCKHIVTTEVLLLSSMSVYWAYSHACQCNLLAARTLMWRFNSSVPNAQTPLQKYK